jgi:hypothetical protein
MGNGKVVRINAPQAAADAPYVQSLDVNGTAYDNSWLTFGDLEAGGTYAYTLGAQPNTGWASSASSVPPSDSTGQHDVFASAGPSGAGLVIAPGASGTGELDLSNIGDSPVTVAWTAKAAAGVTVAPTSGSVTVPADGRSEAQVKVTAGSDEGAYPVTFTLQGSDGSSLGEAALRVAVAQPTELWPYYTGAGIYADGATFTSGFDGNGWAYSQNAFAAAGVTSGSQQTVDGITYTWPKFGDGQADNIEMAGQTIPAPGGTSAGYLGLLGAGTNAPADGTKGVLTVTYTDGTTSQATVGFSDWTLNAGASKPLAGEATAVTTSYRDEDSGDKNTVKTYVFAVKVPLTAGKQVASITLPTTSDGSAHLFALGYGS